MSIIGTYQVDAAVAKLLQIKESRTAVELGKRETVQHAVLGPGVFAGPRPLAALGKASTGPYRILQVGTSISNNTYAPNRVMVQQLKNLYGDTGMWRLQAGALGGTYDTAQNGWVKQNFSGVSYVRSRGASTSTALVDRAGGYGDEVVIEWSREADGGAAEVLVDGVSVGTFGSAGTQKFGMRTTFTVPRGAHGVTINPPAAGFSYLEAIEVRDSKRRGVETIDGTYGGSSLSRAAVPAIAAGNQVASVATTTGAGFEALFARDDVDLILFSFTVNDAGGNAADPTAADYRAQLEQAVMVAKKRNTPMVLIIEPAGHYAIPNDNGTTALHRRYEAVKAHQLEVAAQFDHVFAADWDSAGRIADVATYAATYYPTVSNLNVAAGTYTGDFIHPDGTLASSLQDLGKAVLATTLGLADNVPAAKHPLTLELASVSGRRASVRPYALSIGGSSFSRQVDALYRDPAATNLRPALNTLIAGAGTQDTYGKFYLASNYNYTLGTIAGTNMLVLRIGPNDSGTLSLRGGDTGVHFYDPDGLELGATQGTRQFLMTGLPAGICIFLAVPLSQDVSNKYVTVNGRIYEAVITAARVPVVVAAP